MSTTFVVVYTAKLIRVSSARGEPRGWRRPETRKARRGCKQTTGRREEPPPEVMGKQVVTAKVTVALPTTTSTHRPSRGLHRQVGGGSPGIGPYPRPPRQDRGAGHGRQLPSRRPELRDDRIRHGIIVVFAATRAMARQRVRAAVHGGGALRRACRSSVARLGRRRSLARSGRSAAAGAAMLRPTVRLPPQPQPKLGARCTPIALPETNGPTGCCQAMAAIA